jgi:hypothetical protein
MLPCQGLAAYQPRVETVLTQQNGMRAPFHRPAIAHDHHKVRSASRTVESRWAMTIVVRPCLRWASAT